MKKFFITFLINCVIVTHITKNVNNAIFELSDLKVFLVSNTNMGLRLCVTKGEEKLGSENLAQG